MKTWTKATHRARFLAVALVLAATAGCGQLGPLGDVLGGVLNPRGGMGGGARQGELVAEIDRVDTRDQQIRVTTRDGRRGEVFYDRRTRVIYERREYSVRALERGDIVEMRVHQDRRNRLYTDLIIVRQSARDRGGWGW